MLWEDDDLCAITLQPLNLIPFVQRFTLIPCGHTFHKESIFIHLASQQQCPTCRSACSDVDNRYSRDQAEQTRTEESVVSALNRRTSRNATTLHSARAGAAIQSRPTIQTGLDGQHQAGPTGQLRASIAHHRQRTMANLPASFNANSEESLNESLKTCFEKVETTQIYLGRVVYLLTGILVMVVYTFLTQVSVFGTGRIFEYSGLASVGGGLGFVMYTLFKPFFNSLL